MILGNRGDDPCNHQVNIACLKRAERNRPFAGDQVTNDARMPAREPVDDEGQESC
jgi:hypothetical protein